MAKAKTVSELSGIAQQLNSESDDLSQSISQLNDQLASLKLGLEFWWDEEPIADTGLEYDSFYSPPEKSRTSSFLGYGKIEDKWQLALKTTVGKFEWDNKAQEEKVIKESWYDPLTKASRDVRLEAALQFDDFLVALKEHAVAQLAKVKLAKKQAELK